MQNGLIHDAQITGSSYRYYVTSPQFARLNGLHGWSSFPGDFDQWFQVDFIAKVFLDEIQTQGLGSKDFYIKTYKLLYGDDGYIFTEYAENSGPKVCSITVHCMSPTSRFSRSLRIIFRDSNIKQEIVS